MHEVQTLIRFVEPSISARTRWIFGFQRRLVRRWECETFIPKLGCFPQISHTAATTTYLAKQGRATRLITVQPEGRSLTLPSPKMRLNGARGVVPARMPTTDGR